VIGLVEIKRYPLYYAGRRMHWAKGAVAGGFVFLAGTEGLDPETLKPVEGIKAQTRLALEKIKQRLEEMGSSLSNIVKLTYYIVGDFPEGIVSSQKYQEMAEARDEFFREKRHRPIRHTLRSNRGNSARSEGHGDRDRSHSRTPLIPT
jgi:enamine deaminase RidA (YjgF/YER057c/UK114 family)